MSEMQQTEYISLWNDLLSTWCSRRIKRPQQQGLIEWARAFKSKSLEEVNRIDNPAVKKSEKTMEMIMSNSVQRERIRMRRDAEIDRRTEIRAAERNAKIEIAKGLKKDGVPIEIISSVSCRWPKT